MKRESHLPPVVAIVLLLLLVLYIGNYLALVKPYHRKVWTNITGELRFYFDNYRWGGVYAEVVFSPLEQIDRKVRPSAWPDPGIDGMHRSCRPVHYAQPGP